MVEEQSARKDDPVVRAQAQELARRLNLLLDVVVADTGQSYNFADVSSHLKEQGINLSAGRWSYMLSGEGALTSDVKLLSALARFFEVDPAYLLDWDSELPKRIDSQLELVKAIRVNRLASFATRLAGPLDDEGVRLITELINRQMADPTPEPT